MSSACDLQRKMVQFCRTGVDPEGVGMQPERAMLYRDLIFFTVQSALLNYYPLTSALLGEEKWQELTRDFFAEFPCGDPQFWKMPKGLAEYAKIINWGKKYQAPFLSDLLHFEWLEIEVCMMEDSPIPTLKYEGDVLEEIPYLNPEHRLVTYSYPVFQEISLDKPLKKGTYPLFSYRHPDTLQAHFFSLSPFFQTLIEIVGQCNQSGHDALKLAAQQCKIAIDERLFQIGRKFLEDLVKKRAILGFKP
ncbi:MAG: putative DNA-binding domain-containing protein [Verrucomicrobia bacterium]|nr:putative DNA-binding domain-containing protein [Verrucomicrobiota bacterium]